MPLLHDNNSAKCDGTEAKDRDCKRVASGRNVRVRLCLTLGPKFYTRDIAVPVVILQALLALIIASTLRCSDADLQRLF